MEMAQVGVGVKTRARAPLAVGTATSAAHTPKRRKINKNTDEELNFSASSSFFQPKTTMTSASVVDIKPTDTSERCSSPSSDEFPASCCSSNGSIGFDAERIDFLDLEVESAQVETSTCNCGDERREMSVSSEVRTNSESLESMERVTEANSRRVLSTPQKMPTELELQEFFDAAEKDIQKRFLDKYNYDIVKDVPLEGRYEWVQSKP